MPETLTEIFESLLLAHIGKLPAAVLHLKSDILAIRAPQILQLELIFIAVEAITQSFGLQLLYFLANIVFIDKTHEKIIGREEKCKEWHCSVLAICFHALFNQFVHSIR